MILLFWLINVATLTSGLSLSLQVPQTPLTSEISDNNAYIRHLKWGKVNFLHTTDTHAWYAGHLKQEQYSASWGDYISFVKHMRELADDAGVDLIVVDSGDKHDGNGLSDASSPNGEISMRFFAEMDFDLLSIGNHELYLESSSLQEFDMIMEKYLDNDKYLAANVEILMNGTWTNIGGPANKKYKIFTTKNTNLKVLSLGFLFNFPRYNSLTRVKKVSEVLKESWFINVLRDNPDLHMIIVVGHVPVQLTSSFPELLDIHIAIRRYFPDIPIEYFGGHSHVRDFTIVDENSVALQSGRYCETVGFLSVDYNQTMNHGVKKLVDLKFNRKYIDFNLNSFMTHSKKTSTNFHTDKGLQVSHELTLAREYLNITEVYGYVPHDYLVIDNSYPSKYNLYSFLEESILTRLPNPSNNSRITLINSGSIRYDMYKGEFTKDTMFIVSPFQNKWLCLPSIEYSKVKQVIDLLNHLDYIIASDANGGANDYRMILSPYEKIATNAKLNKSPNVEVNNTFETLNFNPTLGYVTCDDYGCDGDDTPHIPYSSGYDKNPNIVHSEEIFENKTELVDLVLYNFLKPYVAHALDIVNGEPNTEYPFEDYDGLTVGEMLKEYVVENWQNK